MKYDNAKYRIGMIVEDELRPKLGRGKIMRVEGDTLTVHFEQFGRMDIDGSITPIKIVCANGINVGADYFGRPDRICSSQGVHEPSTPCPVNIDIDVSYFEKPDSLYSLEQLINRRRLASPGFMAGISKNAALCSERWLHDHQKRNLAVQNKMVAVVYWSSWKLEGKGAKLSY
jgi:hypothetical protein